MKIGSKVYDIEDTTEVGELLSPCKFMSLVEFPSGRRRIPTSRLRPASSRNVRQPRAKPLWSDEELRRIAESNGITLEQAMEVNNGL